MSTRTAEAPLVVSTDGTAGPYVIVTAEQLDPVVQSLRDQNVPLNVDDEAVMLDGRPALMVIDLGHDADVERVQGILDRISVERRKTRARPQIPPSPQELIIKGSSAEIAELGRRIESATPGGWTRRADLEQRMRKMRAAKGGSHCFVKKFGADNQEYAVWVEPRGPGELYIPSIIPLRAHEPLSVDRHNEVLEDFEKTFVEPLVQGLRTRPISYEAPREPMLEDVLSTESMNRLKRFSITANKSMLSPLDVQRWNSFVAGTHHENVVLNTALLADWLQGEGWPERQRLQLVDDYEHGRSLLTAYDEERVDR